MRITHKYLFWIIVLISALATLFLFSFTHSFLIKGTEKIYPMVSEEDKYYARLTDDIIQCESSGIETAVGDNGKAYGLAQFHKSTFDWMCKLSGKTLYYYSAQDQRELLRWALENNYGRLWTCWYKVRGFQQK